MNDFIVRGLSTVSLIDAYTQWDNRNGGQTTYIYQSTNYPGTLPGSVIVPNDLILQGESLINAGWSTDFKRANEGPRWNLVATYPADLLTDPTGTRIPDIQWDIEPFEVEQNILEANDIPFISGLSTTTKALIENALKYPRGVAPLVSPNEPLQLQDQIPNAQIAYNLKVIGTESRLRFSVILKRTLIVPKWYNPFWALVNNGKLLSKSFLVNNYFVPLWVANQLPNSDNSIQTDINNLTTFYSYLEYAPERHNIAGNKVEWRQSWKFDRWSCQPNGLYVIAG
jgi:hypothetical protein